MIYLGQKMTLKKKTVKDYLAAHDIKKILVLYPDKYPMELKTDIETRYVPWDEIIMYRTFYPLLEWIDKDTLIIVHELMRTQNRADLTYNCVHHYLNQCGHRIVFEFFPFIEDKEDFMILMDFLDKDRYKGKKFDRTYLMEKVECRPHKFQIKPQLIVATDEEKAQHRKKTDELFANLGQKDPDTIPRNLAVAAGAVKKRAIAPDKLYVARNQRFKLPNVKTYGEVDGGEYTVLDFHYRRINFNDFLKDTRMKIVEVLTTTLPIDEYDLTEFTKWKARLYAFYELQASLHRG